MKKRNKLLTLLPIFLLSPSLMAISNNSDSFKHGYDDFEVSVKEVEDPSYDNLYEFTIKNTGDKFIDKEHFYATNPKRLIYSAKNDIDDKLGNTLIKPGDTGVIYAQIPNSEKDAFNDPELKYESSCYEPRNDLRVAKGPYKVSVVNNRWGNELFIECDEIKVLKELEEQPKTAYLYYYAVSFSYEGEEYCVLSTTQNTGPRITISYDSTLLLKEDKITINQIDSFYVEEYVMNCSPRFNYAFLIIAIVMVLSLILGFAITYIIIARNAKKKEAADK